MSFDDWLKCQTLNEQISLLIHRNAWRKQAGFTKFNIKAKAEAYYEKGTAKDGIRLAEIMNPIPENI